MSNMYEKKLAEVVAMLRVTENVEPENLTATEAESLFAGETYRLSYDLDEGAWVLHEDDEVVVRSDLGSLVDHLCSEEVSLGYALGRDLG